MTSLTIPSEVSESERKVPALFVYSQRSNVPRKVLRKAKEPDSSCRRGRRSGSPSANYAEMISSALPILYVTYIYKYTEGKKARFLLQKGEAQTGFCRPPHLIYYIYISVSVSISMYLHLSRYIDWRQRSRIPPAEGVGRHAGHLYIKIICRVNPTGINKQKTIKRRINYNPKYEGL